MVEAPLGATYMPTRVTIVSPIVLPPDANTINLRAGNIQLLPNFHGLENENPYEHIKTFEEACSINLDGKMNADTLYLKLFPFSLKDKARNWLNALPPRSINSWIELQTEFLKKFFSLNRTHALKRQILNYSQKPSESFEQAWERYKDILLACPHHGYDKGRTIMYFYDGLQASAKQFIDTMCNGLFFEKTPTEAHAYLEELAEHTRRWETSSEFDRSEPPLSASRGGGMHQLKPEDNIQARIAAEVNKRLQGMNIKPVNNVEEGFCTICQAYCHDTSVCPTIPAIQETLRDPASEVNWVSNQGNRGVMSNTYNPSWRNHENFRWGPAPQQQPPLQQQQQSAPYIHPNHQNYQGGVQAQRRNPETQQPQHVQNDPMQQLLQMQACATKAHPNSAAANSGVER